LNKYPTPASPNLGEELYLLSYKKVRRGLRRVKINKNKLFKGLICVTFYLTIAVKQQVMLSRAKRRDLL